MKLKSNRAIFAAGAVVIILILGGFLLINNLKKTLDSRSQTPSSAPASKIPKRETTITFTKDGVNPDKVEVKKGQYVVWVNNSGTTIDLASGDHPTHLKYPLLNFGDIKDGGAAMYKFEKEGTYSFHNHKNPSQNGTVIVK